MIWKRTLCRGLLAAMVLTAAVSLEVAPAQAAPMNWKHTFTNDFTVDEIRLYITEGDVTFVDWKQPKEWATEGQTDTSLIGKGPTIEAEEGRWRLTFAEKTPFTITWESYLGGQFQGSGTLVWDKNWTVPGPDQGIPAAMVPVPIPTTLLLLGAGLMGLVGFRQVQTRRHS